jgi:hypothetical protein
LKRKENKFEGFFRILIVKISVTVQTTKAKNHLVDTFTTDEIDRETAKKGGN